MSLPFYKLQKPEYLFRPSQLVKRLFAGKIVAGESLCSLPWGALIHINAQEVVGKSIHHLGVYELATSELIYRALDFCDEFVDIGANIGYFSLVALGNQAFKGKVHAFEPHPKVSLRLSKNINLQKESSRVQLHQCALSTKEGTMTLYIPDNFNDNEGIASLEKPIQKAQEIAVAVKRLDQVLEKDRRYILKIDTEGHEEAVLNGAEELFKNGQIQCVFFEEFNSPQSAKSFELLKQHGFDLYRIERAMLGPKLVDPYQAITARLWEPVNYLAIKKSLTNQLHPLLTRKGWDILK